MHGPHAGQISTTALHNTTFDDQAKPHGLAHKLPRMGGVWMALVVWLAVGCTAAPQPPVHFPQAQPQSSIEQNLRAEAAKWEGTPHRLGGTNRTGIDCSGLVMRIFSDLFDKSLPRTTRAQARMGRRIELDEIQAGDLLFFDPPGKQRHVGIYLSRGEFVHTSYSQGVMISNLNNPYWRRTFWTVRRIL